MRSDGLKATAGALFLLCGPAAAQVPPPPAPGVTISRHPTGANVNADGASTVFITFGNLSATHQAGEALWCGAVEAAALPELGNKCVPGTIFGRLPARFDRSTRPSPDVFTDIMALPASVTRRAMEFARAGHSSDFFYVRQFLDTTGAGAHEYISLTCVMAGRGAAVGLSLNDVTVYFEGHRDELIYAARRGVPPPRPKADLVYNGTGRLKGRWEAVFPGEPLPSVKDLMTEGSLTTAERRNQKTYTLVERFDIFLPPDGKFTLPGPRPENIPVSVDGRHQLLLRLEVFPDRPSQSNLTSAQAGAGIEHHGVVAAFPMPALRYSVGVAAADEAVPALREVKTSPVSATKKGKIVLEWADDEEAALYRVDIRNQARETVRTAYVKKTSNGHTLPATLKSAAFNGELEWRVSSLDDRGRPIAESPWVSAKPGE